MAESIITRSTTMHAHDASATATNFFTGSLQHGVGTHDPYVTGYAFILWLHVPKWLSNVAEFKALSQKNFKSFSGLQNIQLETEGLRGGFTVNELHYAKSLGAKPSEFNLKFQAHSGAPMERLYNEWVSGIRDPKTGVALYPKKAGIPYHSSNHTGTLLYVVTRPDADNFEGKNIEHASLWTHVEPKTIHLEHYNFESGNHDFSELEQTFSGQFHFGEEVEAFAASYVAQRIYPFYTENAFNNLASYTAE